MNKIIFISEPALYYLIFRSRKPQAIEFQRWVYCELLPQARQLGRDETISTLQNRIKELEEENKQIKEDDQAHYTYAQFIDALLQSYNDPHLNQVVITSGHNRPVDLDNPDDPRNIFKH